jgi:hypothetical protein
MKKKDKGGRFWLWLLSLLLIIGAALVVIYFIGSEEVQEVKIIPEPKKPAASEKKAPTPKVQREIPNEKEVPPLAETPEPVTPVEEDECVRVERNVKEFFDVLDKKPYIQSFKSGMGTRDHFKRLIIRLASVPPVPAGEGTDPTIMTKNIFHFFRALDRRDIGLIREILTRENDTMELNLDLFYQWLMLGERCPDPEKIRPPLEVTYLYAGFFLNTIGGRAYLFRRPTLLRILVSYYSLLIVHEADKKGKNSYGIDIYPLIIPVREELRLFPDLLLKKEYISRLNDMESYYRKKR